jgi:hypothetical protein
MIALFIFAAVCFWIGISFYYWYISQRDEPVVAKTSVLNFYIALFAAAVFVVAWKYAKKYFLKRGV